MQPQANQLHGFAAIPLPGGEQLPLRSALVMGIVNVTPDSFSDGGRFARAEHAVRHALDLVDQGAALLDVGGESTRPTAEPVSADEETARVVPVIRELRRRTHVPVSVDTSKAEVAAAAIDAGAAVVNDVWGFQRDPELAHVVARSGAAAVLMHNRGHDRIDAGIDIIADVLAFLSRSIDIAARAGVDRRKLIVDPGFGFGKTHAQNLVLLRDLQQLAVLGCPVLLGVSRKSTIGFITDEPSVAARLPGSLAAALSAVRNGAAIVRVHDVAAHIQALRVMAAIDARAASSSTTAAAPTLDSETISGT